MTSQAKVGAVSDRSSSASASNDRTAFDTRYDRVVAGALLTPALPGGDTDQMPSVAHVPAVGVAELTPTTSASPPSAKQSEGSTDQTITYVQAGHVCAADPFSSLLLAADFLDDAERVRLASENRVRSLTLDPGQGGKGLPPDAPVVARWQAHTDALAALEHGAALELKRALRKHPLGAWVVRTVGVGEKQGARLLAAIGDPYWNDAEDRARRGPAELWAYCGLHTVPRATTHPVPTLGAPEGHVATDQSNRDIHALAVGGNVAARRQRGTKANWNAQAKMRVYLVAESCMKQRTSPYRAVYDRERAKWEERATSDGHKHAHALRVVSKAILRDLWCEARDLHKEGSL